LELVLVLEVEPDYFKNWTSVGGGYFKNNNSCDQAFESLKIKELLGSGFFSFRGFKESLESGS
jgi:hypothetical protein